MKKIIFVVIAMITCLCLCGCPQPSSPAEPEVHPYGYGTTAVAGETCHLIVGKFDSLSARDEVIALNTTENFLAISGQAKADRAREVCSTYTHTYVVDGHFTVEQARQAREYIKTLEIIPDDDVFYIFCPNCVRLYGMHNEYWAYLVAD